MIYQHMWFSIANMLTMSYHLFRPLAPSESEQTPKGSGRRGSGFLSFLGRRGAPKTFKDRQKTTKEPRLELIESIIKHAHFRSYPNNIGLHSTRWCNFGHSLIDDSRPHIWVKREVRKSEVGMAFFLSMVRIGGESSPNGRTLAIWLWLT